MLSSDVVHVKYADNTVLDTTQMSINQEITISNDGEVIWPVGTILLYNDELSRTDVKVAKRIELGQVQMGYMARIRIHFDPKRSKRRHHFIVYDLCYPATNGVTESNYTRFSNPITFQLRIAALDKSSQLLNNMRRGAPSSMVFKPNKGPSGVTEKPLDVPPNISSSVSQKDPPSH